MPWERRANGRKYFYRGYRQNGRVVKEYFGTGPLAELAAMQLESRKQQAIKARSQRQAACEKILSTEQASLAMGKVPLKKIRKMDPTSASEADKPELPVEVAHRVRELEALRQTGDHAGDDELVQLIHQYPQLAATTGDLARVAIAGWLDLTAGSDSVFRAALEQRLESLRNRFSVAKNDQAGQFIVERIVTTWLHLAYAEARMSHPQQLTNADLDFLARRQQQAQKQHFAAIQAWRQWQRFAIDQSVVSQNDTDVAAESQGTDDAPWILPFPRQAASA